MSEVLKPNRPYDLPHSHCHRDHGLPRSERAGHLLWEMVQLPVYTIWRTGKTGELASAVAHCAQFSVAAGVILCPYTLSTQPQEDSAANNARVPAEVPPRIFQQHIQH